MIERSHYAVTAVSRPERLAEVQAEIDAAVEAYLQAGGAITRLDNKGSPVEHLSWREEAARTKAAGLSYVRQRDQQVLSKKPEAGRVRAAAARRASVKIASTARSSINATRRAKLAPKVRMLAECRWTVGQIARHLEIAPGTVRRIGQEHSIELNRDRGAMPVRQGSDE